MSDLDPPNDAGPDGPAGRPVGRASVPQPQPAAEPANPQAAARESAAPPPVAPAGGPVDAGFRGRATVPPPPPASPGPQSPPAIPSPPVTQSPPVIQSPPVTRSPSVTQPPPTASPPRRSRPPAWLVATVIVLLLATAGVLLVRPGPVDGWLGGDPVAQQPSPSPEPTPPPVLVAADAAGAPTPDGVDAAIDELVTGAGIGGRLGVSVIDAATGETLYQRAPDRTAVPASTTKIVTAVAVLTARGPTHRIPTTAVAGAQPGEVVLVGGGDPTLAVAGKGAYRGAARLDELADQVRTALGGVKPTKVTVDSSLYSGPELAPGWDSDIASAGFAAPTSALMTDGGRVDPKGGPRTERYRQPDIAAGQAFARQLGLPAAAVEAVRRGTAPPPAEEAPAATGGSGQAGAGASAPATAPGTELGRVESPPILRLVEFMLVDSDNTVAEALARQVALAREKPASYAGAADAMEAVLADLGLPGAESELTDGSGLSRRNRISSSVLTDLLTLAAAGEQPQLGGLLSGLPVAGWNGTLADRFQAPSGTGRPGLGVVRAKTGTLSGVHSMSGVVFTADGDTLAFALLADQVAAGQPDAQAALDAIAAALARCGCR